MTLVVSCNAVLQPRGSIAVIAPRRRRLSTIMARHAGDRRAIPLVFRRGVNWREATAADIDRAARLRSQYASTLVGPHDTVVLYVPVRGRTAAAIGLALAAITLIAIAGPVAGALGATGLTAIAIQVGFAVGAAALSYAASRVSAANKKTAKDGNSYASLSGGGNVARVGDRRPLVYGRCWTSPPLSQKDWFCHMPNATVVYKRMTLGIGKFQVHNIRIGESLFWNEESGVQAPFNAGAWPGTDSAVEVLYETPSTLMVGDAVSSDSVTGQELPRPLQNPSVTPWFRLTPQGVQARKVLLNWTYLGLGYSSSKGERKPAPGSVIFEAQRLAPGTGNPTGPVITLYSQSVLALKTSPVPQATVADLPDLAEWQVRGRNLFPENPAIDLQNAATWDGMTALIENGRTRAGTTEIAMRVSGVKGLPTSSLSDVQVEATRIVSVWTGSQWVEQPSRKAVWALADLIRGQHGLGRPDSVDVDKFHAYANRSDLAGFDTFDGVLPSVSSFWEAGAEILSPMRAEPVKVGSTYSFARDESAQEAGGRRVITRRQILRDTSQQRFDYTTSESENGDVVVEYDRDGDPKRPDEARQTIFAQTRTPKRLRINGVTKAEHAIALANWVGARSLYRGNTRKVSVEWDGRLIYPGTHIAADLWYVEGKAVVGVESAGETNLVLDAKPNVAAGPTYALIRNRRGREWGVLAATYDGDRGLALDPAGIAMLAGQTGLGLVDVIAKETQDPTTVMLGPLVELQQTYMASSAIPSDPDRVDIEMVYDDPRVWLALSEPIVAPGPLGTDTPAIIDRPVIPSVTARCERIETGIELVWGIGNAIGAVSYDAQISYDAGATYEDIQVRLATQSGRVPIRQSPDPVFFRARGYGQTGLPGPYQVASFTTVPPVVDAELVDLVGVTITNFDQYVQGLLVGDGPGSIGEARARADAVLRRLDEGSNESIDLLAEALADLMTRLSAAQGHMFEKIALIAETTTSNIDANGRAISETRKELRVGTENSAARYDELVTLLANDREASARREERLQAGFRAGDAVLTARILLEEQTRASETFALATRASALEATVDNPTTGLTATRARIGNEESTRASQTDALATRALLLEGSVNDPTTGLQATRARLVAEETTRGSQTDALASRSLALEGTVNNPTTGLPATRSAFLDFVTVQGTANSSYASRLTGLETVSFSPTDGNAALKARIATEEQTRYNVTSSIGSRTDVIEATVFNGPDSNANIRAAFTSFTQAQATLNSSLSSTTSDLTARVGTAEANISNVNQARVDGDAANATAIQQARAVADSGTAEGRFAISAVAGPAGTDLVLAIKGRRTNGDTVQDAGLYIVFPTGGGAPEIVADTTRFRVGSLNSRESAFEVVDGFVRLKNGLIAPGAIATSKIITIPQLAFLASGAAAQNDVHLYGYDVTVQYDTTKLLDIEAKCSVRAFNATVTNVRVAIIDVQTGNIVDVQTLIEGEVNQNDVPTPVSRARYFVRIEANRPYVIRYIFNYVSGTPASNFRSNGMNIRYLAVTENQI